MLQGWGDLLFRLFQRSHFSFYTLIKVLQILTLLHNK